MCFVFVSARSRHNTRQHDTSTTMIILQSSYACFSCSACVPCRPPARSLALVLSSSRRRAVSSSRRSCWGTRASTSRLTVAFRCSGPPATAPSWKKTAGEQRVSTRRRRRRAKGRARVPVLDLGSHGQEGLLHVGGVLCARLQERNV